MSIFLKIFLLYLTLSFNSIQAEVLIGKVVGIADGDTLTILDSTNSQFKIRLSGIDAPEKKQAFGNRAKQAMSDLVFSKEVAIDWSKKDRYGRIIGKVSISKSECNKGNCTKNIDVGLELIKLGFAWHYKKYASEQTIADRAIYSQAEIKARVERIGLWSDPNLIAPWDFRHKN